MNRAATNVFGACVLTVIGVIPAWAQETSSATTPDATTDGVYVGGQFGVLGGSSLWTPYDLGDGSGSQFGGLNIGYTHRVRSGVVFGGEADLSFGAEPDGGNVNRSEIPEMFGTMRGKIGYGPKRWSVHRTGGLAWSRNQLTAASGAARHFGSTLKSIRVTD